MYHGIWQWYCFVMMALPCVKAVVKREVSRDEKPRGAPRSLVTSVVSSRGRPGLALLRGGSSVKKQTGLSLVSALLSLERRVSINLKVAVKCSTLLVNVVL